MTTLAGSLARAFGDIDTMKKLYHPDIVWKLSESLGPIKGPYDGIDAVLQFNERVWGRFYYPECTIDILDELGNDELSAVRFLYTTKLRRTDEPYSLEYVIFARGKDGKIHEIAESMDTLGSANLFAGKPKDLNPYIGKSSS